MIIYEARNIITDEVYIGVTKKTLQKRISDHTYEAFKRKRCNKFHSALREFGLKNFKFKEVGKARSVTQCNKLERLHIIKNKSIELGYNSQVRKDL